MKVPEQKATNVDFMKRVSVVARIAAQWNAELVYGAWNPEFLSAPADERSIREFCRTVRDQLERIEATLPTT